MKRFFVWLLASVWLPVMSAPLEIGEAMTTAEFWKSDPVMFVQANVANGFEFTTDQREGADSRLDGGVRYFGVPVYESKVAFGPESGIERVELLLFTTAGTERIEETAGAGGQVFRRRVRKEKTVSHAEFGDILATVRAKNPGKASAPVNERMRGQEALQFSQSWPRTQVPTATTMVWNYRQNGKHTETFRPGFIRVTVDGPARLAKSKSGKGAKLKKTASGAKKIADNVVHDPRGDVFIDNVPMVDQGQKGYCAVASAERVLKYYGLDVDEHEVAEAAGTTADGGTSVLAMKDSVSAIGRKYRLATVVAYGDFDKGGDERIAGLENEVKAYNKMARKLRKPIIEESVYIRRSGDVISYNPGAVDAAMDPAVRKEMKTNGMQKSKFVRFLTDVRQQVEKGIPLFWGVNLGIYPEPGLPQTGGGHMRLIVGYNDKRKEVLYSDSWGAGHELKRMPADWAFSISHCLMYMKPLGGESRARR